MECEWEIGRRVRRRHSYYNISTLIVVEADIIQDLEWCS